MRSKRLEVLKEIVEHQSNLEPIWSTPMTTKEAALMWALRHLHAVIEGHSGAAVLAKDAYWDIDSEL